MRMSDYQILHTLLDYRLDDDERDTFNAYLEQLRRRPHAKLSKYQRQYVDDVFARISVSGVLTLVITSNLELPKRPPRAV